MKSECEENQNIVNNNLPEHEYALKSADLGTVLRNELKEFTESASWYKGYADGGIERCNSFLKRLQSLGYQFTVRTSVNKHIGSKTKPRLTFSSLGNSVAIQMFGPPFIITRSFFMECLKGPLRCAKVNASSNLVDKKIGCPAKLCIKIIKYFPQYGIKPSTNYKAKKVMSRLKDDMLNPNCVIQFCERVYISVSKDNIHTHEPLLNPKEAHKMCKREVNKPSTGNTRHCGDSTDENHNMEEDSDNSCVKIEPRDDSSTVQILLMKQEWLKSLAQDIATISNLIMDEQLLDRGVMELKELLDDIKRPFFNGSIVDIKEEMLH